MKDIKKVLKTAGVLTFVINFINILSLLSSIFYEFSVWGIVENSICIVLSLVTGIIYLVNSNKTTEEIMKHKGLFISLIWINIFNDFFVWIVSLWVEFSISFNTKLITQEANKNNDDSVVLNEQEYQVKKEAEQKGLAESLKELEELRDKQKITEEEYTELRKSVIDRFLKK